MGISDKRLGRVGDTPLIGAGTYAHNASCAVAATGQGEFFIRGVAADDIAARMRLGDVFLTEAAQLTVDEVEALGGTGGVVAIDRDGNIAMPFSSNGMFRAYIGVDGKTVIRIFETEDDE